MEYGGIYPHWRPDGKELYYIGPDGQMMAAPITATVATLEPGTPVALFQTRIFGGGTENGQGRQYDVGRDGRFLHTPLTQTRNRKRLETPAPFDATWELRLGPDNRFRVLYEVDRKQRMVNILAIGVKDRNKLLIAGEEFE